MDNVGVHEVIVETPLHEARLSQLEVRHLTQVVRMYRERCRALTEDHRWEAVVLFRNSGGLAGASLAHPHAQLVALPVVPKRLLEIVAYGVEQYQVRKACTFCDLVARERAVGSRVVYENEGFMALAPFAPRIPFETWLFPKHHEPRFMDVQDDALPGLADALHRVLGFMDRLLENPPFNMVFHSAPPKARVDQAMHWYLEIMPRLAELGGFEWGSDCFMHPVFPETAAKWLREGR